MKTTALTFLAVLVAFTALSQSTPPSVNRSNASRTQVDPYATVSQRFGFPTGSSLTLDASTPAENTAKLFWRTSDSTLHVYVPSIGVWLPAGGGGDFIPKGNVLPLDLGMSTNNTVPVRGNGNVWIYRGVTGTPSQGAIPLWTTGGQLMTGTATTNGSAVNLGQLNDSLAARPTPSLRNTTDVNDTTNRITVKGVLKADSLKFDNSGNLYFGLLAQATAPLSGRDYRWRQPPSGVSTSRLFLEKNVGTVSSPNWQTIMSTGPATTIGMGFNTVDANMVLTDSVTFRAMANQTRVIGNPNISSDRRVYLPNSPNVSDTLATVGRLSGYLPLTGNTSGTPMTGGIHMGGQGIFNARIFGAIAQEVNGWGELGIGSNNPNSWGDFRLARYYNTDTARLQLVAPTNKSGTSQAKQFWYAVNNSLSGDQNATVSAFLGSVNGRMPTSAGNGSGYAGSFVTKPYVDGSFLRVDGTNSMAGNIRMDGNDIQNAFSIESRRVSDSTTSFTEINNSVTNAKWASPQLSMSINRTDAKYYMGLRGTESPTGNVNALEFRTPRLDGSDLSGIKFRILAGNNETISAGDVNINVAEFRGSVLGRMPTSVGNGSGYASELATKNYADSLGTGFGLSYNNTTGKFDLGTNPMAGVHMINTAADMLIFSSDGDPFGNNVTQFGAGTFQTKVQDVIEPTVSHGISVTNSGVTLTGGKVRTSQVPTNTSDVVNKNYVDGKLLVATAVLDFPSISDLHSGTDFPVLNVTVSGAVAGNAVALGIPSNTPNRVDYKAIVIANNTVAITAMNLSQTAIDPPSGTFTVRVFK